MTDPIELMLRYLSPKPKAFKSGQQVHWFDDSYVNLDAEEEFYANRKQIPKVEKHVRALESNAKNQVIAVTLYLR